MKTLEKDELYENVHGFLKAKGVELKPGSYSQKIQQGCALLSDAINTSQKGLVRAKVEIDKKLDQLRQVIHEKTAPRSSNLPRSGTNPTPKGTRKRTTARKRKSKSERD